MEGGIDRIQHMEQSTLKKVVYLYSLKRKEGRSFACDQNDTLYIRNLGGKMELDGTC